MTTSQTVDDIASGATVNWEEGEARVRRAAARHRVRRLGMVVAGWIIVLAIWQWWSTQFSGTVMPPPLTVADKMWEIVASGRFLPHFWASLWKTFAGFGVAVVVGAPVGYMMGRSNYWKAFFQDSITAAGTIPALTYAVLSLVIFGISTLGPVLAVALVSVPYVAINVAEGIRGVDRELIKMSQAFGRSQRQIRRHVLIPSIVPFIFAAVRLSFAVAWKVEALTEVFGGRNGVGFQIQTQYQMYSIPGVLAWTFLFVAVMLVIERFVLVRAEERLLAWRPAERIRS